MKTPAPIPVRGLARDRPVLSPGTGDGRAKLGRIEDPMPGGAPCPTDRHNSFPIDAAAVVPCPKHQPPSFP